MLENNLFSKLDPGPSCNYNCSYCWLHARSSKVDPRQFEVYTNAIDEIKRLTRANGFDKFALIHGGESHCIQKVYLI